MIRFEEKPCTFDGVSVDVCDYFVQFETVSLWNKWTKFEMACQLVMNLRGEAQTVLRFLSTSQLQSFDILKQILKQRFNPIEREAFFKVELKTCQIKENESIFEFGQRFKVLAYKAYPDNYFDLDLYFTDLFIASLNSEMAKFVVFKHPSSLDEAISLALEYETFCRTSKYTTGSDSCTENSCCSDAIHKGFLDLVKVLRRVVRFKRKKNLKSVSSVSRLVT